jgi:membrane protein
VSFPGESRNRLKQSLRLDLNAFQYLSRGRLWKNLWHEVYKDDCFGMAAQLSFYFLLAFFPFLLFLSALIGFIPIASGFLDNLLYELQLFLPTTTYNLVVEIVQGLVESQDQGVLTIGIVLSLWSASLAFNGMVSLLNSAYEVEDSRSYLKTRALSILVTLIVTVFVLISGILLFFGDWLIGQWVANPWLRLFYTILRWGGIFFLINIGIQFVFFALPAKRLPWKILSPGSVIASVGWILGSAGFRYYVNHFGDYQQLYGSLGALIVLMIWFYISSLFLLLGGEIDSEIFKMRRSEGYAIRQR